MKYETINISTNSDQLRPVRTMRRRNAAVLTNGTETVSVVTPAVSRIQNRATAPSAIGAVRARSKAICGFQTAVPLSCTDLYGISTKGET